MRTITITSTANAIVKETRSIRERRSKYGHEAFLIEGPHLLEMAIKPTVTLKRVFVTEDFREREENAALLQKISRSGAEFFSVSGHVMKALSDTETPQGVAAVASCRLSTLAEVTSGNPALLVALDSIRDPGNVGAIIRTADAVGADAVIILPGTADPFAPKTLRATAGSIFNLPLVFTELPSLRNELNRRDVRLLLADSRGEGTIYSADLRKSVAFVFGSESHGGSPEVRAAADALLKVPILGRAESLNVAAAAAVCLYEAIRQRGHY